MIELTLREIADATGGEVQGDRDLRVAALTTDSRDVPDAALFVALRGEHHDGHDHLDGARSAGARAFLAERGDGPGVVVTDSWHALAQLAGAVRRRVDPFVVALTGSVGKTTTKDLAAAAVGAGLETVAAPGSYNNEVGVPLTLLAAEDTTEALIVEIGARGVGHIASLAPIVEPDVAIVTAVAAAHTEMFGDVDTVARAKGELVEALDDTGAAILNGDDERVAAMASRTRARVLTFGTGSDADLRAEDVALDRLARARFTARTPWGSAEVTLPLAGGHHVGNALAAIGAAGCLGLEVAAAAAALADARVSAWRSQVVEGGGVVVLNDAYNANPTSVLAALRTLVAIERPDPARTWAVLGYMAELGATEAADHADVGVVVEELGIDHLVVVGERARPMLDRAEGRFVEDAAAALALLEAEVRSGDVVLVKASRVAGLERVAEGLLGGDAR